MTDSVTITVPWTWAQVEALNEHQTNGLMHPYTCGDEPQEHGALLATPSGWICRSCMYRQNWAHDPLERATTRPDASGEPEAP